MRREYRVIGVKAEETYPALLETHYAKRIPSITHAFGLFDGATPLGYVTYGTPSSAPLREGVAGKENAEIVIELNRLVMLADVANGPSHLVGRSLRMLPKPRIIVSYADCGQGHVGYVYQACNFIYTGLSAKRTDWRIRGREGLHGQSVADISKSAAGMGRGSRAEYMRERFGDDFYLEGRSRKHRYIYIVGSKSERARIASQIRYPVCPYPKGESTRYVANAPAVTQPQLFGGHL